MATDLEKLVVQLSADIKGYEREMRKAMGVSNAQARAIENRFRSMNRNLDNIGKQSARALIAPLSGIGAALSVREVLRYADAWTSAKNSLAVSGVVGAKQVQVLERLYQAAQRNAAPIGALADLYGKAAQASDNLGASQEDLLRFSSGVATALRVSGTSATAASGALTQLGQLLGQARVQAEEFNSVNEGARPILIAVANGLDEAGGSVSKLKTLVNEGKVSGQQFFQAFLRGLPTIQSMAANATQTIEQGYIKVNNALTKYIGSTDESLGASQRLVQGLNALADNFDEVADTVLQLAAVIAGALVGRSIATMIAKLGLGVIAIRRFVQALAAARTMAGVATAITGIGAAAGPVGLAIGTILTGALIAFGTQSGKASDAAEAYANALSEVEAAAGRAGKAVDDIKTKMQEETRNRLGGAIVIGEEEIAKARAELDKLFRDIIANAPRRLISAEQLNQLEGLRASLADNTKTAEEVNNELFALANANPRFQRLADQFKPLLDTLIAAQQATKNLGDELKAIGGTGIGDPRAAGFGFLSQREAEQRKTSEFLSGRSADAAKSELERDIDTRTSAILKAAEEVGVAITEAAARIQAQKELGIQRQTAGLSSAVSGYVDRTISAESGGKVDAKNPLSTATGLGQFIESTWLDLFRRHFPAEASSRTRSQILQLRNDATYSKQLIEAYARENAAILQKAGISVADAADEYKLHLAHFLGPKGAIAALTANPNASAASVLGADAARSNPSIIGNGRTIGDVIAYGERRAGMKTGGTARLDAIDEAAQDSAESQARFDKTLSDQRQYIEALKAETAIRASLNPLVNDYGLAMSTVEAAQYLLNAAMEEGTEAGKALKDVQQLLYGDLSTLSPAAREQAEAMRELALSTGNAEAAGARLTEQNDQLARSIEENREFAKNTLGGFIRDLREGKSAAEALANSLDKVADRLLDIALDSLFPSNASGGGGGFLGGLFGGGKGLLGGAIIPGILHRGGVAGRDGYGHGRAISAAAFSGAPRYHNGGIAGLKPGEVPAILQKGEVVLPKGGSRPATTETIRVELQDDSGRMAKIADQRIMTASGAIVQVSTLQSAKANRSALQSQLSNQQKRGLV